MVSTEQELEQLLHRAVLCLDRNDIDGFRSILHSVQGRQDISDRMKGEVLLLTIVAREIAFEDIYEKLLEAEKLIGGPSRIMSPQMRVGENHYDALMTWGNTVREADEMEAKLDYIAKIGAVFRRMTGFGNGIAECYHAQRAFYRGEFALALELANSDLCLDGSDGKTGLIRVYMLEIIAGIAKHTMDVDLWRKSYVKLRALANGELPASRSCREQAEVVCMMLEMSLGCLHEVPGWVRTGDFGVIPAPHGYEIISDRLLTSTLPTAMVAHMEYLSYSGEYVRALQTAAMIQRVFGVHNLVLDAYMDFLCADCYFNLDKPDYGRRVARRGMAKIAKDELWLIAAEFVPMFGETLYAVAAEFDPAGPEKIRHIGEGFGEKLAPLRNEMLRGSAEGLTKREQEVMNLAMEGHSNAEIAEAMNISVRTVRFHLENVYSKLNISRRSKFVSDIEQSGVQKLARWVK